MANRAKTISSLTANRIRELRLNAGFTQKDLALRVFKSESAVRMWELGKSEPDLLSVNALAQIFNTSVDYLLGKDPEPQKEKPAEDDGLSPNRRKLIDFARSVPEDKVEQVYSVIQSILEALR